MKKPLNLLLLFTLIPWLVACENASNSPQVRIATNPWPGYELLFVADKQGYFKEEGLNIKLLQLASLVDVQRTFVQGRADGMASTVIEAIIVAALNEENLKVALIPDYSYGGDVIIASKKYDSLKELKGKKIGVETGSLGIVILEKALKKHGMAISDIQYVNLEQLNMKKMLENKEISASITYPPFSTEIMRSQRYHTVFTTKEIPKEIIDVISVREEVLNQDPDWIDKFQRAWSKSLDYLEANPDEAMSFMAEREGITKVEFEAALGDLYLLKKNELKEVLYEESLKRNIEDICETLISLKTIDTDCKTINTRVGPV